MYHMLVSFMDIDMYESVFYIYSVSLDTTTWRKKNSI